MDYYGRMHLSSRFLIPLLLALMSNAQAQINPVADPTSKHSALDSPLFYELLLGELSAKRQEPAAGFSLMLDAARKTNDPVVFRRAVQMGLQARSGESALMAAKAWSAAHPTSKEANLYVLQVMLGLNRVAETLEPLKRDLALTPAKEVKAAIWSVPGLYERASDRGLAANTVQKALGGFLSSPGSGPTAWAAIGRMWLSANDKPAALNAAGKGLSLDVNSEHSALVALSLLEPRSSQSDVLVLKHLPNARPEFHMAFIKGLLNARRESDAAAQLESLRTKNPTYPDTWLIDGALALQAGQLDHSQQSLTRYLDLTQAAESIPNDSDFRRGRSQAFFSLSHIAQLKKDFPKADALLQLVNHPQDVLRAQLKRAALMSAQGQLDAALTLIHQQPEQTAQDAQLKRATEVQLLREHKQFAGARAVLQQALSENPEDLDLAYDLAMLHEKLGELDEMEQLLRQLMVAKPTDPHAYNALGYSLADRGLRLPEATELIRQALKLSANDPFITDSLAWAEFRSGRVQEALVLLEKAFQEKPDAEIAAHLGEVLWALNRTTEAQEVWRAGLKINPDNETLKSTLKRLQVTL